MGIFLWSSLDCGSAWIKGRSDGALRQALLELLDCMSKEQNSIESIRELINDSNQKVVLYCS